VVEEQALESQESGGSSSDFRNFGLLSSLGTDNLTQVSRIRCAWNPREAPSTVWDLGLEETKMARDSNLFSQL
jgi:hypothetical protein